MIKINQKEECSGCHACTHICPINCIVMIEDSEGFLYPHVDNIKCINCGLCEKTCPILNNKEKISNKVAYACINKNEDIRFESSSGGVFSLLAESVINNRGIVFGAGFDYDFNLVHSYTDTIEGLSKFRGSKYLQSKIGESYKQAQDFLEKGTKVLFSGTPCQIAGFIHYLRREYDNLICVDIICHGVPSPKVFKKYKRELQKKYDSHAKQITFRWKEPGWKAYSVAVIFDNNTKYKIRSNEDVFMRGFLNNLYLRPSCYNCKYKTLNKLSDITIGDFWGIENVSPELDDDKGTSLVLVNSDKGKHIFDNLQDEMLTKQVDLGQAIKCNPSAVESVPKNSNRDRFFLDLDSYSDNTSELIMRYTKISFTKSIYMKIRTILSKIKRRLLK